MLHSAYLFATVVFLFAIKSTQNLVSRMSSLQLQPGVTNKASPWWYVLSSTYLSFYMHCISTSPRPNLYFVINKDLISNFKLEYDGYFGRTKIVKTSCSAYRLLPSIWRGIFRATGRSSTLSSFSLSLSSGGTSKLQVSYTTLSAAILILASTLQTCSSPLTLFQRE